MPYLSLLPLLAAEASALGLRTAAGMTAADVNLPGAAAFFLIVGTVAGLTAHVDVLGGTAAGILHIGSVGTVNLPKSSDFPKLHELREFSKILKKCLTGNALCGNLYEMYKKRP